MSGMSVFRLKDGTYRGVIYVKDAYGQSKRKEFRGKTERAVKRKIKDFEIEYQGKYPTPDMTVKDMCRQAIDSRKLAGRSENTIDLYEGFLKNHIEPSIGLIPVTKLTPYHIEELIRTMSGKDGKKNAKPVSSQTKTLVRNFLRMAINKVAMKARIVQTNVAELSDAPKVEHQARPKLTREWLQTILKYEENPTMKALWLFLASTGLRPIEALNLTWEEVWKDDNGPWIQLLNAKTPKGREPIPLSKAIHEGLPKHGSKYVFASEKGTAIDYHNMRRSWYATIDKANKDLRKDNPLAPQIPQCTPYSLRKLFGSTLAKTAPDHVLRDLMRHTDIRTTKQFYVGAFDNDKRSAVDELSF